MKAKVTLASGNRMMGVADSGKGVLIDAGPAEKKIGPSPLELVLIGTAGCTAIDVVEILRKKRQNLAGLTVGIDGERATETPRVFTKLVVRYTAYGDVDKDALDKAVGLSQSKYCSASVMLRRSGAAVSVATEVRPADEFDEAAGPDRK
ncbi:MAG TPA: OsmC family protein [Thermoplasmata archaeon]|nr:OsmC family protein [Thermoplasmata archaeon]